ncbi:probable E3 ubiquitin-protein ligase BAH1-like 1 isoform X1 [Musa acuminata AAA Group]|uniref:probable E3 ubiquitin-protein ligase BAH1-like 1 isoform X1 n=1 Tax=Musa acuminata AAA Group TaxID=214697 RepID=UPI0031DF6699
MKFCKRYEDYMRGRREKELPALGLKQLKKILKRCGREFQSQHQKQDDGGGSKFAGNCAVCDGTFFPSLHKEMSAVVVCFNQHAQKLLKLHLASGFRKLIMWLRGKSPKNDGALIQEGKDLVAYAIINSIAMRKILKKYDKVHCSKQGQAFRSKAPSMHIEILQSPWLCELMAFYINLRQSKLKNEAITELYNDCSLTCDDDGKPTLSCGLFDSMQIEIDLTCSICLNTVFDPVALTCGHLFCYMCCCAAASITIVDGLKAADPKTKCPLCRQEGVNAGAMHLVELNILLSQSCPEYWEKRCQTERVERVRQAKEHWQSLCREFMALALTLRLA